MLFALFLIILAIFCSFIIYFLNKKVYFCENYNTLTLQINSTNTKFDYIKLKKTNIYFKLFSVLNSNKHNLGVESFLFKNKNFLLTISKFIDYKINNNKITYRGKGNLTIVENLGYIISKCIYKDNPYVLFNEYKKQYNVFNIKQKENKIFKYLLAKFLLIELIKIKRELNDISNIIQKYKKCKYNSNYSKNIYNYAKFYSFLCYNQNSTYYKNKLNLNTNDIISTFFSVIFEAERQMKIIITYLKTMF